MKRTLILAGAVAILVGASCSKRIATGAVSGGMSSVDSVAYAFGVLNGERFAQSIGKMLPTDSLSRERILEGFTASFLGKPKAMTEEQAQNIFGSYIEAQEEKRMQKLRTENDSVLRLNATREGVHTTESGLQWRKLRAGNGAKPKSEDTVEVHYIGRTIDGKEFDNSYRRGRTASFPLNQVIQGWQEGLALMNKGAKYELYIPYQLGYGERGAGEHIPPYSTLIFEVELIDIKPQATEEAPTQPVAKVTAKPRTTNKTRK